MSISELDAAYTHCLAMARNHYENFPVASHLLPARMRRPVAAVYAFARTADDFADEGDDTPEVKLQRLDAYGKALDRAYAGMPGEDPVFIALADVADRFKIPASLFHDLLSAFRQDVTKRRYANHGEVLEYCRHSANPVGRLLLHLHGSVDETSLRQSDAICSALQIINFLQDLGQDYDENDRIYMPQDEMARFGVTEAHFAERRSDENMQRLITHQLERTRAMMLEGAPLGRRLGGRFGLELRLITQGGLRVLGRLETNREDLFARPRLGWRDWAVVALRALY